MTPDCAAAPHTLWHSVDLATHPRPMGPACSTQTWDTCTTVVAADASTTQQDRQWELGEESVQEAAQAPSQEDSQVMHQAVLMDGDRVLLPTYTRTDMQSIPS